MFILTSPSRFEQDIKKSRFLALAAPVADEAEAKAFIAENSDRNANHNCWAWRIGQSYRFNDDGEPSGTAGIPMLEVLKKREVKDTVVVVTRYFGGIKLGAGGLIRAYGRAVSEGLNAIGVVERRLTRIMHTQIEYTWLGKVENELRSSRYSIKKIHYLDNVEIETYVASGEEEAFTKWMTELTNGQAKIWEGETLYLEFDVPPK